VLVGLWGFYLVSGELQTAQALAEQQLTVAQRQQDSALLLQGYFALGNTLSTRGELVPARTALEHGIALYDPQQHRDLAFRYGQDPGTCCLGYAACTLWLPGYPEQARRRSQEMLTRAQALSHTFSIAFAHNLAIRLHRFLREWQTVLEQAGVLMALVSEQGYAQLVASCIRDQGMALAAQGQVAKGLTMMRQGLTYYRATGAVYYVPLFLAWLADTCGQAGEVEEGLLALTEALTVIETTGERVSEAELHRLKGELLLQQSSDNTAEAETCFQKAITIAQSQSAKSWELRAATSLAKLWQSQGKREQARQLLGDVYNWFTEGFDTPDLIDAKALLDELSEGQ
jgi:predicted ATPase